MVTRIAEHSVDLDLLPPGAKVLDIGCRGFLFTKEMQKLGHRVYPVDIDLLEEETDYIHCAISDYNGKCGLVRTNDVQATKIDKGGAEVDCFTLKSFSDGCSVSMWDLIKIDVEGSEYEIIMSLESPPAKQLSIEFHLHTGVYKVFEVNAMENKLKSLGYEPVKHDYTAEHCAGFNYWDSLFILK